MQSFLHIKQNSKKQAEEIKKLNTKLNDEVNKTEQLESEVKLLTESNIVLKSRLEKEQNKVEFDRLNQPETTLNNTNDVVKDLRKELLNCKSQLKSLEEEKKNLKHNILMKDNYLKTLMEKGQKSKDLDIANKNLSILNEELKSKLEMISRDCKFCQELKEQKQELKGANLRYLTELKVNKLKINELEKELQEINKTNADMKYENVKLSKQIDKYKELKPEKVEELSRTVEHLKRLIYKDTEQRKMEITKTCNICKSTANLIFECFKGNDSYRAVSLLSEKLLQVYKHAKFTLLRHIQSNLITHMLNMDGEKDLLRSIQEIIDTEDKSTIKKSAKRKKTSETSDESSDSYERESENKKKKYESLSSDEDTDKAVSIVSNEILEISQLKMVNNINSTTSDNANNISNVQEVIEIITLEVPAEYIDKCNRNVEEINGNTNSTSLDTHKNIKNSDNDESISVVNVNGTITNSVNTSDINESQSTLSNLHQTNPEDVHMQNGNRNTFSLEEQLKENDFISERNTEKSNENLKDNLTSKDQRSHRRSDFFDNSALSPESINNKDEIPESIKDFENISAPICIDNDLEIIKEEFLDPSISNNGNNNNNNNNNSNLNWIKTEHVDINQKTSLPENVDQTESFNLIEENINSIRNLEKSNETQENNIQTSCRLEQFSLICCSLSTPEKVHEKSESILENSESGFQEMRLSKDLVNSNNNNNNRFDSSKKVICVTNPEKKENSLGNKDKIVPFTNERVSTLKRNINNKSENNLHIPWKHAKLSPVVNGNLRNYLLTNKVTAGELSNFEMMISFNNGTQFLPRPDHTESELFDNVEVVKQSASPAQNLDEKINNNSRKSTCLNNINGNLEKSQQNPATITGKTSKETKHSETEFPFTTDKHAQSINVEKLESEESLVDCENDSALINQHSPISLLVQSEYLTRSHEKSDELPKIETEISFYNGTESESFDKTEMDKVDVVKKSVSPTRDFEEKINNNSGESTYLTNNNRNLEKSQENPDKSEQNHITITEKINNNSGESICSININGNLEKSVENRDKSKQNSAIISEKIDNYSRESTYLTNINGDLEKSHENPDKSKSYPATSNKEIRSSVTEIPFTNQQSQSTNVENLESGKSLATKSIINQNCRISRLVESENPGKSQEKPREKLFLNLFQELSKENEKNFNKIISEKLIIKTETDAKEFIDNFFEFFVTGQYKPFHKLVNKVVIYIILLITPQHLQIQNYYYNNLLAALKSIETVDKVINRGFTTILILSNINFFIFIQQWDLLIEFFIDLIRLPNIHLLDFIKILIPQVVFPQSIIGKYSSIIDILKLLVIYEYSTGKEYDSRKWFQKSSSLEFQRFWLNGQTTQNFQPINDSRQILQSIKQVIVEYESNNSTIQLHDLDKDVERKYFL